MGWSRSALSEVAMVSCGVRQGGAISPVLFNVLFCFIFINLLRSVKIGCHVNGLFLGCLFYADDVMLLCPSMVFSRWSLTHLSLNSHCLAIGKLASLSLPSMLLDSHPIPWVSSIKYLGVYIVSGTKLSFDITSVKQSFLLPVTLFMLRLRVLMRRIYLSVKAIALLF